MIIAAAARLPGPPGGELATESPPLQVLHAGRLLLHIYPAGSWIDSEWARSEGEWEDETQAVEPI